MVLADCESELFRDESRGLEGGAFFLATLLNRQEAKTSKGKNAIDSLKDFYMLKSDATFCHLFFHKFGFDSSNDNTPHLMRTASPEKKRNYLHDLVSDCLRDLLPYFKGTSDTSSQLLDHPLLKGRIVSREKASVSQLPAVVTERLEMPTIISPAVAEATASELVTNIEEIDIPEMSILDQFLIKSTVAMSTSRSKVVYTCQLCMYETKYTRLSA